MIKDATKARGRFEDFLLYYEHSGLVKLEAYGLCQETYLPWARVMKTARSRQHKYRKATNLDMSTLTLPIKQKLQTIKLMR